MWLFLPRVKFIKIGQCYNMLRTISRKIFSEYHMHQKLTLGSRAQCGKPQYSPTSIIRTSIIRTRDAKKIQGQSTHCDHVTSLRMRSKPTLLPAALLSNLVLTLREVKETQGKHSLNWG